MIDSLIIFTTRPWNPADGDPASPDQVLGIRVTRSICSRTNGVGALVALVDRRFAITGRTVTVGSARQLRRYIRERGHWPLGLDEGRWLDQVAERLAAQRAAPHGVLP